MAEEGLTVATEFKEFTVRSKLEQLQMQVAQGHRAKQPMAQGQGQGPDDRQIHKDGLSRKSQLAKVPGPLNSSPVDLLSSWPVDPDASTGEYDKMVDQCATLCHCLRSLSWCSGEGDTWLDSLKCLVSSQSWFPRCESDTPMCPCASDNLIN